LISVPIDAVGLALICWPRPVTVGTGAALAGIGYSLAYPAFDVDAVRGAPRESGGLVMGLHHVSRHCARLRHAGTGPRRRPVRPQLGVLSWHQQR
jgi:hypothetical protein